MLSSRSWMLLPHRWQRSKATPNSRCISYHAGALPSHLHKGDSTRIICGATGHVRKHPCARADADFESGGHIVAVQSGQAHGGSCSHKPQDLPLYPRRLALLITTAQLRSMQSQKPPHQMQRRPLIRDTK
ncbi:hypothetical protein EVAR_71368_1 [Eumeta japonica]|uniref:Uncharacterized protein n=1 Tax=Eumeta variegata TaxID=151549 RepID=A0A4C2A7J5_EUMVA|nr:hypothetical protein EVAR_71368_1 [Eumeta japonica]